MKTIKASELCAAKSILTSLLEKRTELQARIDAAATDVSAAADEAEALARRVADGDTVTPLETRAGGVRTNDAAAALAQLNRAGLIQDGKVTIARAVVVRLTAQETSQHKANVINRRFVIASHIDALFEKVSEQLVLLERNNAELSPLMSWMPSPDDPAYRSMVSTDTAAWAVPAPLQLALARYSGLNFKPMEVNERGLWHHALREANANVVSLAS